MWPYPTPCVYSARHNGVSVSIQHNGCLVTFYTFYLLMVHNNYGTFHDIDIAQMGTHQSTFPQNELRTIKVMMIDESAQ